MKVGGYDTHPAADLFPMMGDEELRELAADIERTGQRHPVVVLGAKILDGRNRAKACSMVGIEPQFTQYEGPKDLASLLDYVVSLNLSRRHLSASQRAWLGALLEEKYAEAAKAAQRRAGGDKRTTKAGEPLEADRPQAVNQARAPQARDRAAAAVGSSGRSVQKAKLVREKAATEIQRAVVSGELTVDAASEIAKIEDHETQRAILEKSNGRPGNIRAHIRQHQQREIAKELQTAPPPPPSGPYRVIVADPPWKYDLRATDATHRGNLPYPPMTTDAICALPVAQLGEDGSVLWMWVTNGHLLGSGGVSDGLRVVHAWGFEPKALLTWVKPKLGLGHYLRNVTEHCILAVRGKPTIVLDNESTLLEAPVREHSRKPDEFYALVEKLTPGSKIELFAREPREGWAAWGAEVDKFAGVTSL